jgi:hypothetical protein
VAFEALVRGHRLVSWLVTLGFILAGVGLVIYQANTWLKYAVWPPYTIGDALRDVGVAVPYSLAMNSIA